MSLFGVEVNAQISRLVLETRLKLAQYKISPNLLTIVASCSSFDKNKSGVISIANFEKALKDNRLFFKVYQMQIFEKAFANGEGLIYWPMFVDCLRVPMNQSRRNLVITTFDRISQKQPSIATATLMQIVEDEQFKGLISLHFSGKLLITAEDFLTFYDALSVNFPHDEQFIGFVSKTWNGEGIQGRPATAQQTKQVIRALRFKLIQKTKGTNDEFFLRKMFQGFDQNQNGAIGVVEFDLLLKKVELNAREELVARAFSVLDKNLSGLIEYEEFKRFLFFDPFPA